MYGNNGEYTSLIRADGGWVSASYGSIGSKASIIGDSVISGGDRAVYYNGVATQAASISNIIQGNIITVGAIEPDQFFNNGYTNEILYYQRALNNSETAVVQNYLSSKWGTDLAAATDYYAGDINPNGDYDYYVTGILKLSDSNVAARSQGGLTITDGYLKDSGDAIFAGYKGLGSSTDDLPNGVANVRSDTVRYFDTTDTATVGGKVNLGFDLAKLGLEVTTNSSDYVLLCRSNQTGQFYQIAVADSITGSSISFDKIHQLQQKQSKLQQIRLTMVTLRLVLRII